MTEHTRNLDPRIQHLIDKEAIREVVVRYFRGLDGRDPQLVDSVYHPDAVDVRGSRTLRGDQVGDSFVRSTAKHMASTRHHVTTHSIDLQGDTAVSEAYCLGVHVTAGDPPQRLQTSSRYHDRLERRAGEWRIVRRDVFMDMIRAMPIDDGSEAL